MDGHVLLATLVLQNECKAQSNCVHDPTFRHSSLVSSPLMKTLDWSVETLGREYNSTGLCIHFVIINVRSLNSTESIYIYLKNEWQYIDQVFTTDFTKF